MVFPLKWPSRPSRQEILTGLQTQTSDHLPGVCASAREAQLLQAAVEIRCAADILPARQAGVAIGLVKLSGFRREGDIPLTAVIEELAQPVVFLPICFNMTLSASGSSITVGACARRTSSGCVTGTAVSASSVMPGIRSLWIVQRWLITALFTHR